MKILHIAPFNVANVPYTFIQTERELGYESRLVTFAKNPRGYPEDICLNLPFLNFQGFKFFKRLIGGRLRTEISNIKPVLTEIPPKWKPNKIESNFIQLRETIWKPHIDKFIKENSIEQFDIIQLDGGLDFYRDGRDIIHLKNLGKKIICCYTGSDLRTRGVIPEIDKISDLNVSVEFDHLQCHPNLNHIPFPFDNSKFELVSNKNEDQIIIGHAPTNRAAKGSDAIISIVEELKKNFPVKLNLIENMPYEIALKKKAECHIFIDQIGDLGYGINSLESLSMGIATCSCLAEGFEEIYSDHPFIVIDESNMKDRFIELIENKKLRFQKGTEGREWVKKYHDPLKVVNKIHTLLKENVTTQP